MANTHRATHSRVAVILLAVVVLLCSYVLSVGPAAWTCEQLALDDEGLASYAVECFYEPLAWATDRSSMCDEIFWWYLEKWRTESEPTITTIVIDANGKIIQRVTEDGRISNSIPD
jgi:hypothetical protein